MVVEILALVAFLIVIVGAVVLQFVLRARREKRMRALAEARGWTYEVLDKRLHKSYKGLEPFGQGSSRHARHIIRGEHAGGRFEAFQYEYTVSSGKSSHTVYFRVLSIVMPIAAPGLIIKKEHVGHKIFDALGGEDIDFESDAFSRRFWVRCPDRRFAYDIIHPGMMAFLMHHPRETWQWHDTRLVLFQKGHLEPNGVLRLLRLGAGFVEHLPRHRLDAA